MRGLFLALDGLDGTGKSTQCGLLAGWLAAAGHAVESVADPGGTPLGAQLREILLHQRGELSNRAECLLFMASHAELVETRIRPALQAGAIVVSDRFLLSTVVYQGHAGRLPVEEVWAIGALATGGLLPDLTLVLDLPVTAAQARRGRDPDRMEARAQEFHERVRDGFRREAALHPGSIQLIDAHGSVDAIQVALRGRVAPLLAGRAAPGAGA